MKVDRLGVQIAKKQQIGHALRRYIRRRMVSWVPSSRLRGWYAP